jgi:hypothetical protein
MLRPPAKPSDAFNLPQTRHPERSAAQIYRITDGLWREVEEPVPSVAEGTPAMLVGRCPSELSNHELQAKRAAKETAVKMNAFSRQLMKVRTEKSAS